MSQESCVEEDDLARRKREDGFELRKSNSSTLERPEWYSDPVCSMTVRKVDVADLTTAHFDCDAEEHAFEVKGTGGILRVLLENSVDILPSPAEQTLATQSIKR